MPVISFTFNWKLALFVLIFLPITLRLGFWQLDRAEEKRQSIAEFDALVAATPADLNNAPAELQDYQPAAAIGRFLPYVYLLDNQVFAGKVGYEVVQVFLLNGLQQELASKSIIFVSRGFVPQGPSRAELPTIKTPEFDVHLRGYIYQPKKNSLLEGAIDAQSPDANKPTVVQQLLVENLYKLLPKSDRIAHPFLPVDPIQALAGQLLRLDDTSPYLFKAHWQLVNNSPEKHIGYAVQWFSMAGLLLVLFIWASLAAKDESDSKSNS